MTRTQPPGPTVALALGTGGARGFAHIGAIQEITARGMRIAGVAGTSMGALVGGVTAAGRLDEFAEWASGLQRRDMFRLVDPAWSGPGAIAAERLIGPFRELVGDARIEELRIPFTAVATDLVARREVWFQSGPLHSAIRASIAIPGIITPVLINGRLLADGGLMNPVPIEPTAGVAADLTVAVSLAGPRTTRESATPSRESTAPQRRDAWRERMRRTLASLRGSDDEGEEPTVEQVNRHRPYEEAPAGLRVSDITALSFDAMQGLVARYRMAGLPPDVLVTVPVSAARTLDFHKADAMIELGRELTARALDQAGQFAPEPATTNPESETPDTAPPKRSRSKPRSPRARRGSHTPSTECSDRTSP